MLTLMLTLTLMHLVAQLEHADLELQCPDALCS